MAFILNHLDQSINVSDNSTETTVLSECTLQIPVVIQSSQLSPEYRNIAIIDQSPDTPITLLSNTGSITITPNSRLHFHDSNKWNSVAEFSDISLINAHNSIRLDQEASPLEDRLTDLETQKLLPIGSIFMWTQSTLPPNFVWCDGQRGSPDLRDTFILCGNSATDISGTGGTAKADLQVSQLAQHKHVCPWGEHWRSGGTWGYYGNSTNYGGGEGADWDNRWPMSSPIGSSNATVSHNNIPPYYAVGYIYYTG